MKIFLLYRKIVFLLLISFSFVITTSHAEVIYYRLRSSEPQRTSQYNYDVFNAQINNLYHSQLQSNASIATRVVQASNAFLGRPYSLDPLGEGSDSRFDQDPLYRTDAFDCLTYVETVIALAEADDLQQFKTIINHIRYHNGDVSYVARNHFISVDWDPNNQRNGYLRDVTTEISAPYKFSNVTINIPNWFRNLPLSALKMFRPITSERAQELLMELHALAEQVSVRQSHLPYIPMNELFSDQHGQVVPNQKVFAEIPSGSVIELVRPSWDLTKRIGTRLNVEHMGIAVRTAQGLEFYEASSSRGRVMAVPLTQYLLRYDRFGNGTEFGINVEQILQT
jgi:hypothetical protein